jgi:hypothetical protein
MSDYHYSHIIGSWTFGKSSEPPANGPCLQDPMAQSFRPARLEIRLHSAEITESMAAAIEMASQAKRKRRAPPSRADRLLAERFADAKTS